jgi:formylglycine-generating enzyme required for sulfatase activity
MRRAVCVYGVAGLLACMVLSGCTKKPDVEMISVPAGTFTMGNSGTGDDATYGNYYGASVLNESPAHSVTLSAYQIGKHDVTNKQYCDVLNWALAQGYLKDSTGANWAGTGDIYAGGVLQTILAITDEYCNIWYSGGEFSSKTRVGLPESTDYSMDMHPVVVVSWYGAVAFCNWLSQMEGLTPCYDMTMGDWPLTVVPPTSGGYRLPTEAEWERAAAWDGSKHWIYGFTSDTMTGHDQCNYCGGDPLVTVAPTDQGVYDNPLGLKDAPYTTPVGWFNGVNVNPNGNIATKNSVSPVGCYDMSGNVGQWVQDQFTSYDSGGDRVVRGGSWAGGSAYARSAYRFSGVSPDNVSWSVGFRVARTSNGSLPVLSTVAGRRFATTLP